MSPPADDGISHSKAPQMALQLKSFLTIQIEIQYLCKAVKKDRDRPEGIYYASVGQVTLISYLITELSQCMVREIPSYAHILRQPLRLKTFHNLLEPILVSQTPLFT